MSGVELLEAPPAASSPDHPEHTRWVKQQMLQREVDWLARLGLSPGASAIERQVDEGMRRLAARKREKRALVQERKRPAPRQADHAAARELAREGGYEFTKAAPRPRPRQLAPFYACRRCGTCRRCRRELRALNILRMARAGDDRLQPLAYRIIGAAMRAQGGSGEFAGLSELDVSRALTRVIEDVCDQSVPLAGAWI